MPRIIPHSLPELVLLSLLLGTGGKALAACDNCPERSVALYDFDVTAPKPDSLADRAVWYSLFYAASGAASAIFTPQCARFIDGSFYRDGSGVPSNSLRVDIDHPNTAPGGALKGMDYLLNGSVSPDGSGFKVTMSLECACDRNKVITASAHFDDPDEASTVAGSLARDHFVPIADKIRAYEKDARDEDPEVSIGGYNSNLVADPAHRKASMGETVPVTLTLTDCDGEPLAGRKISLTGGGNQAPPSLNGAFAVTEATTGSDGKVTVDFKVGSTRGVALARAYFIHKTPFGCEAVAVDEAAIEVEGSTKYYQVRYRYEETQDMDFRLREEFTPTWTKTIRRTNFRKAVFSGSAIFENIAFDEGDGGVELEGAGLDGGLMNGLYEQSIQFKGNENFADAISTITRANYENRNYHGSPYRSDTDLPDFYVSLHPDDLEATSQFSFIIPFSNQGTVVGAGFEIITAQGQTFDTSFTSNETLSEKTHYGPSMKLIKRYSMKDSVFHVEGMSDTTFTADGTETKLRGKFAATIAPVALGIKPNGIFPVREPVRRQARIRVLNGGSLLACGLSGVAQRTRVRVELHSLKGSLLSVLHDQPRGSEHEISLALDRGRVKAMTGLSVVVFRAGNLRESRVLYRIEK